MQTVYGLDSVATHWPSTTVCIGVFDGVHLGHQAVIGECVRRAKAAGRPSVVITFDRHPMSVLAPERCPKSVLAPDASLRKMQAIGLDAVVVTPFDKDFSEISAEDFYRNYLLGVLHAEEMVVGHDFAFGHGRRGTPEWLSTRIATHLHPPLELDGLRISSSAIRRAVTEGTVAEAARMLGGDYSLAGIVVRGQRLGSEIGVPTANLQPLFDQVVPSAGIYAGRAHVDGKSFAAAISVGYRPAVPGAGFAIEAHLMDFPGGDLYGRSLSLDFVERLRDETSFESMDKLTDQIRLDIEDARKALIKHG